MGLYKYICCSKNWGREKKGPMRPKYVLKEVVKTIADLSEVEKHKKGGFETYEIYFLLLLIRLVIILNKGIRQTNYVI